MTTPGGVPNLPTDALTVGTMRDRLEDMSGAAMRARAGERFPSIMGGSSGGAPLSDWTPFGVLTRLFSEFNAAVANADPSDIEGPEDLPELLLNFIEELPVVGEFVGLLQAITGTYDGDDEILLRLQDLFAFLRPDGMIDAAKLFGELPQDIIDFLRTVISAVFNPAWLSNIVTGQIGTGWSDNLQINPGFDGEVSIIDAPGVVHNSTVFPAGAKGSAEFTGNGTRQSISGVEVAGSAGQSLRVGTGVQWQGVTRSTTGRAFTVEVRPFDAAGAEMAPVVVTGINNPAGSGSWQDIVADIAWPTGAVKVKPRLAVESMVTGGTVRFSKFQIRKGGALPQDRIKDLPQNLSDLFGNFFGLGNAIAGYLNGNGAPTNGTDGIDILGWVRNALQQFTGHTNVVAQTADEAQGTGGNALTNTVSIQTQVQDLVERQDAGWSARPLWASMDYTADPTFPLGEIQSYSGAHVHAVASGPVNVNSYSGSSSNNFSGNTDSGNGGGGSHTHGYSNSVSINISHGHSGSTFASHSTQQAGVDISPTPVQITSTQAFLGYIRCGSVQEKRLFNFLAQASGTVSTFNLDVYRMAPDGTLTLVYSSANFAGAITTAFDWVQHALPAGTASIDVDPQDNTKNVIAIQLRMTGTGSVYIGGKTTPVPMNPPGWVPRRISAVRNPSGNAAPATIAAATANASHTSTAIPYIEAAIDTGLVNAPIAISDNFNGTLSSLWLMSGPNALDATNNQFGIVTASIANGWSWGKFQKQVNTDQARVGFTTISPTAEEQVVWFKGRDANNHVGLAITSSTVRIYTMSGGVRTDRASAASGTSASAAWTLEYNATSKVFTAKRAGATVVTWTDSGNVAPSGLGNRYGGIGLHATRDSLDWFGINATKANPIDDWALADI